MYHPEMLEKLIIINGAHPFVSERELRENPAQRYASNYFFVFNGYLAPGEIPIDENDTRESAPAARMQGLWTLKSRKATTRKKTASAGSMRGRSPVQPLLA